MNESKPVEFTEDRVPFVGIGEAIEELVELYGGELTSSQQSARRFTLPLRRGVASAGAIECTVSWAPDNDRDATVKLTCDRNVDAPRAQRILLLVAGVAGALMFMLWPFYPHETQWGTLAWLGGLVALAVYFMTLRKSSGGIAWDFMRRLTARQRSLAEEPYQQP